MSDPWTLVAAAGMSTLVCCAATWCYMSAKTRKKMLLSTPGVQVRRSAATSKDQQRCAAALSGGSTSQSKWDKSKALGDMGYYYAHHTRSKDSLHADEYEMNRPKLLRKTSPVASPGTDYASRKTGASQVPQKISSYSWEDLEGEVRLTVRQVGPSWDWTAVSPEDVCVDWGPTSVRLEITSRQYGIHAMELGLLSHEIKQVTVRKMKQKLVLALVKRRAQPWRQLQRPAAPAQVPGGAGGYWEGGND